MEKCTAQAGFWLPASDLLRQSGVSDAASVAQGRATWNPLATKTSAKRLAMNAIDGKPDRELCSAKHSLRSANFYHRAPQANSVQLAGGFNHWNPVAIQRRDDGWWFIQVMLIHGHHQYRFLVDGKPVLDARAAGISLRKSGWGEVK